MEPTPQQTCDTFVGSGAFTYPWWRMADYHGISENPVPDDWWMELCEFDPESGELTGGAKRIDHATIMEAVETLSALSPSERPEGMHPIVIRECRHTVIDGPDYMDFDADMADQVLQYIMFGKVVYG